MRFRLPPMDIRRFPYPLEAEGVVSKIGLKMNLII